MKPERIEKIRSLLHKEVSLYIQNDLDIKNIQIVKVLLSPDLKKAKFLFIIIDEKEDQRVAKNIENYLNKNSRKIKNSLFRFLGLRIVPDFIFEYYGGGLLEHI